MAISMLKIRRPLGRLIFNMGIAIPGKTVFLIETAPWFLSLNVWISYAGWTYIIRYTEIRHLFISCTQKGNTTRTIATMLRACARHIKMWLVWMRSRFFSHTNATDNIMMARIMTATMSKWSAQNMNLKIYEHVYISIIYAYVYIKYVWTKVHG